jgi:hypothetical protein
VILAVVGTAARGPARDGATSVLTRRRPKGARRRVTGAEPADAGQLGTWGQALRVHHPIRLAVVTRTTRPAGCVVRPTRGMVERPLGWLHRYRRLSQDDADLPGTSDTMIQVVMIHRMSRRLARIAPY